MTPASFRRLVEETHTPELQAKRGKASGQARLRLSEDTRSLAMMLAGKGMSQRMIAKELDIPRSTVASWLSGVDDEALSVSAPKGGS